MSFDQIRRFLDEEIGTLSDKGCRNTRKTTIFCLCVGVERTTGASRSEQTGAMGADTNENPQKERTSKWRAIYCIIAYIRHLAWRQLLMKGVAHTGQRRMRDEELNRGDGIGRERGKESGRGGKSTGEMERRGWMGRRIQKTTRWPCPFFRRIQAPRYAEPWIRVKGRHWGMCACVVHAPVFGYCGMWLG